MSIRRVRFEVGRRILAFWPDLCSHLICYSKTRPIVEHGETRLDEQSEPQTLSSVEKEFLNRSAGYRPWTTPPNEIVRRTSLTALSDVTLLGDTGAIVSEREELLLTTQDQPNRIDHKDFMVKPLQPKTRQGVPSLALIGCGSGYRNLYHFLVDRLPKVFFAIHRFGLTDGKPLELLVDANPTPFQQDCFRFLTDRYPGLTIREMPPNERWQFDRLHVVDNWQNIERAAMPVEVAAFIRELFITGYGIVPAPAQRRIWVSRADSRHRRIKNERELWPVLEKHGFEIFMPWKHSYAEQVHTFAEAKVVAGAHGAGFTNLIFTPEGGKLLEIFPHGDLRHMYLLLAKCRQLTYRHLIAPSRGWKDWFSFDPATLDRTLAEFLKEDEGHRPRPVPEEAQ